MTGAVIDTPRHADPVLSEYFGNIYAPTDAQLHWLTRRHGVPPLALARDDDGQGWPIGAAFIVADGGWFDFAPADAEGAQAALVLVARGSDGEPRDLVAWTPRDDGVFVSFGGLAVLGEQDVLAPQIVGPLLVHRGILGWLRAGRRGVVVLDRSRAWLPLLGIRIQAEDFNHGLALRDLLAPPPPTILVSQAELKVAA